MLHNEGHLTRNYTQLQLPDAARRCVHARQRFNLARTARSFPCDPPARSWSARPMRCVTGSTSSSRRSRPRGMPAPRSARISRIRFAPPKPNDCADCHICRQDDNNAIMAQLLMQGTNALNFIGHFCLGRLRQGGMNAVAVTESDEPQAVIGSRLHELAYPDYYRQAPVRAACDSPKRTKKQARSSIVQSAANTATPPAARRLHRLRHRQHRQQGFQRAHHHRAGLAAGSALLRDEQIRHQHLLAFHAGDRSRLARTWPRTKRIRTSRLMYAFFYVTGLNMKACVVIGNPLRRESEQARRGDACSTAIRITTSLRKRSPTTRGVCSTAPAA